MVQSNTASKTNTKYSVASVLNGVFDETNNLLKTSATISGDVNVDSTSVDTSGYVGKASGTNADFTTAYASATTITLSSLPTGVSAIKADDIVAILQVATDGSVTNTYGRDDATITASGTDPTTITVTGASFVATDSFVVYTNIPRQSAAEAGNVDGGTQRVTVATDDVNLAAIKTAIDLIEDAIGTVDSAAPTKRNVVGAYAESTVPTEVADGDVVDPWYDTYGRQVPYGANLSENTQSVTVESSIPTGTFEQTAITQLTAPGETAGIDVSQYSSYGYSFTVATIDTNIRVKLEGSIDNTNWFTLPIDNTAVADYAVADNIVTITANGTYIIHSTAPVKYVRLDFIDEDGGTAATIDADFIARQF